VRYTALVLETAQERQEVVVAQEMLKPQEIKLQVSTAKIAQPKAWRVQPTHESSDEETVTGRIWPFEERGETATEKLIPDDEGPALAKVIMPSCCCLLWYTGVRFPEDLTIILTH